MSATAIATTNEATTAIGVGVGIDVGVTAAAGTAPRTGEPNMGVCRYFLRGICRFGENCRFSHDIGALIDSDASTATTAALTTDSSSAAIPETISTATATTTTTTTTVGPTTETARPSTSKSWVNAPVFIPRYRQQSMLSIENKDAHRTWAEVAGGVSSVVVNAGFAAQQAVYVSGGLCPYEYDCPFGLECSYQHIELCEMCDSYCLHPTDIQQRRKHIKECLQQHERDMELSFAIARSKDKQCGICFDTIMEKTGREKRFGILPNCSHIFCLECIRKWRQAKQFEHKITRACPECRVASDFVCPSAFWVETKEDKDKLLVDYRNALGIKDCKYFKKGDGKCPFGNKCFYKHALPNGDLVDVGLPQRARKLHRNTDELIDLLDIYLWEFVDQRDYHWLEMLSNPTDSDGSDWADE